MDPLTARLMVNLARVKPGDKVLEPFIGVGAIAVEAEGIGAYVVGVDIDIDLLKAARSNTNADLIHGDARLLPLRPGFDAAVGDPPYGRLSIVEGEVKKLLYAVAEALPGLVKPGGRVVLAGPIYFDLNLYSCSMYLHGGLYRLIYIIRANQEEAPRNTPSPYTSGERSNLGTA
jgi:tRNA (guanine10-N2)-dimethyltransferase